MIKVNKYEVQQIEHFDNNEVSLGFLNEHENTDLRIQIAKEKVSGYYLIFENKKILIEPTGKIYHWPDGLYDTNEKLWVQLFKVQTP